MSQPARPIGVAIVCKSVPPYRIHLHQRIAREMPQIRLWTVRTHEEEARWSADAPPEINLVAFGDGLPMAEQDRPRHALAAWRRGARISRWMRANEIDVVILAGYADLTRLRLLRWCRRHDIPCFISGDSNIRDERDGGARAWLKQIILTRLLTWASGVMPFGQRGEAYFKKYGVPPQRMFRFPLEPDVELIRNLPQAQIAQVMRQFNLAEDRHRLLYSGRLAPVKRVDQLIDAFAAIAPQRPDWDLVIVGDGPLRESLQARVPPDLRHRVIWTGHTPDPAAVAALYRASDVLVLPSEREPWALVIHEAVAAGMAVISSSVPGAAAEFVRDGVNGRVYPAGDLNALKEALLDVTHPQRLTAMRAASPLVLEEWDQECDPIHGLRGALGSVKLLQL